MKLFNNFVNERINAEINTMNNDVHSLRYYSFSIFPQINMYNKQIILTNCSPPLPP